MFYAAAYWIGLRPWETEAIREADRIAKLFDREESEPQPPYGSALDLGCGTGMQSVALARRGWQVTGVELVPRALRAARERAREAGVEVRFLQGDVAALRAAGVGSGFRLVLDFGCFHGLNDAQRIATGREGDSGHRAWRLHADDRIGAGTQRSAAARCGLRRD